MLSFLSSLPIPVLRILDIEAYRFYDKNHQMYEAALLTRCYTQHALHPLIDSEINHKRHFIKFPFINKGIDFIDLPSLFQDKSVTSIPDYFQNSEPPVICYKYNKPIRNIILLTSCLTAVKSRVIRYYETVYETSRKHMLWSIKHSGEIHSKLKSRGFRATSLSTYDFCTLYTTLPHNLIKEKLVDLIERAFKKFYKNEGTLYLACNDRKAFFTSTDHRGHTLWSCHNVCDALSYLLDNIYIRFDNKLYRQIVGILMGTNCAPLVANLFLICYERDFMTSLSNDNQADIIEAFKSTSRYLDDLLDIDNPHFEGMENQIYPPELKLNKANTSDTEAPFTSIHF